MKTKIKDVSHVVENDMCCGCGACSVACKSDAIVLQKNSSIGVYAPVVENSKCVQCGRCVEVCYGFDGQLIEKKTDDVLGKYQEIYCGYSLDEKLRYNAASGGCVSELLRYALQKEIISGAIVAQMDFSNGINSKIVVARTEEEVVHSKGSKYFPIAICCALKDILVDKKKYIFVGLPCHIYGLRKLQHMYPKLKENILLTVGLFCGHMVSFSGTDCFISSKGFSPSTITDFSYRGCGWPGKSSFQATNINNQKEGVAVESQELWGAYFQSNVFTPKRCMLCEEFFATDADVSVGDAWDRELLNEKSAGYSLIIARNKEAVMLLKGMTEEHILQMKSYSSEKVKEIFKENIVFKKRIVRCLRGLCALTSVQNGIFEMFKGVPLIVYWGVYLTMRKVGKLMKYSLVRKIYNKLYNKYFNLLKNLYAA